MVDEMNAKQWEYPTGWPENEAQRDTLKNALLERMLEWGVTLAPIEEAAQPRPQETKPESPTTTPIPMPVHSSYLSAELPKGQLHSAVAAMPALSHKRLLIEKYGLKCHWCGRVCNPTLTPNADAYPTVEHLIRRADGGSNRMENKRVACRKCNNSRHHLAPLDAFKAGLTRAALIADGYRECKGSNVSSLILSDILAERDNAQ